MPVPQGFYDFRLYLTKRMLEKFMANATLRYRRTACSSASLSLKNNQKIMLKCPKAIPHIWLFLSMRKS
ncbi:hypothetical protein H6F45_25060 [Sphaerospermopsis sp. FACHB-1194]|nr:hypothetical protein [Sphaerospermopsis sp. FACHB-1194]